MRTGQTATPARRHWPPAQKKLVLSDSEPLAALATTRGQHGAASTGTHPLAEAMDLGPPTVIRLERALAHWSSRYGSEINQIRADHVGHHAAILGWIHPQGAAAAGTWLSLLTVKGIGAQVKPSPTTRASAHLSQPALRSSDVEDRDFHNVPVPGDLGCGKSMSAGRTAELAGTTERGNRDAARTQLVDGPVDNELRSVIAALGQDARGAHH
jgi:hypothetical protein